MSVDFLTVAAREAAEAVPFGFVLPPLALGQLGGEQGFHRGGRLSMLGHSQTSACGSQSFPLRTVATLATVTAEGEPRMKFDPSAATARYIDSLGPAALQKAHDYTVGKEWMLLWALLVGALVTWLIVKSGILDKLAGKIAERRPNLRALMISLSSSWSRRR